MIRAFILVLLCLLPLSKAQAFDMQHFEQLPVLHEGRVKPIDSLGRTHLKRLSDTATHKDLSPAAWVAVLLFDPKNAANQPIFFVRNKTLKKQLDLDEDQALFSFTEMQDALAPTASQLPELLKPAPKDLTPEQAELLRLHDGMLSILTFANNFNALQVFDMEEQESLPYITAWQAMSDAYGKGDEDAWAEASQRALAFTKAHLKAPDKLEIEVLYNRANLYILAMLLYGFVVLAIFIPQTFWPARIIFAAGVFVHGCAVGTRMYLLERPPVGTLYESVLFVSLIVTLIALFIARKSDNRATLFAGSVAAITMLGIAPYLLQQGESLELLSAVLNTNFWLSTHVLCITAGYGICVLGGCLAHIYLALRAFKPDQELQQKLARSVYMISLVALLFTAIGTILGGIWADQSWGRFWGWDPKENGALLIVLWLLWLQHGRLSGHIRSLYFIAGIAYVNVIVAIAWFGVNLLNVGLHSYGFIDGIAWGLGSFVLLETVLVAALLGAINFKERAQHVD